MLLRSLIDTHLWTCDFSFLKLLLCTCWLSYCSFQIILFIQYWSCLSEYLQTILSFMLATDFISVNSASLFSFLRIMKITESRTAHCRILLQKLSSMGRNLLITLFLTVFNWFYIQFRVISYRSCVITLFMRMLCGKVLKLY